ncbi:MAG: hypothetical protein KDB90_04405 [Planctomycetes bacterium]|nr:hypothetical protein [Planctomycetota bacterium]
MGITRLVILGVLLFATGCASRPAPLPPPEVDASIYSGADSRELIVGAFNMDAELGRAEFSIELLWEDGRRETLLDHWELPDWNLLDGRDTPGTYVSVRTHVKTVPQAVILVDHLRNRRRSFGVGQGDKQPFVAFVLGPKRIALLAKTASGEDIREEPE